MSNVPPDQSEVRKLYYAVEFFSVIEALQLVTMEVERHSWTPSATEAGIDTRCKLCTHYSDDLYHTLFPLCSYWGHSRVSIAKIQYKITRELNNCVIEDTKGCMWYMYM